MYLFTVLADKPLALWPLSSASPFTDYSGYGRSGTASGSPVRPASLVSQIGNSTKFLNTAQGTFASPVFLQKFERKSFTLEAWVLPIDTAAADQAILSHASTLDGLVINGTRFSFVTKYTTAGEARASYDIIRNQSVHVVGIHTESKNLLYINGELVSEVEITDEQQADTFTSSTSNLISGASVGAGSIAMNCVALYSGVLPEERIIAHFEAGRNVEPAESISTYYESDRYPLTADDSEVFLETLWSTDLDWSGGVITDITVSDNQMTPVEDSAGLSVPGTWLDSFALDVSDVPIYSVQVDWIGEGAVVEASLDGTTWEVAQRGLSLGLITNGFDPTDKELQLRVSFPGGIANDTSYISQLLVTGLNQNPLPTVDTRTFTVTQPVAFGREYEPITYRDDNGARISGGSIAIGPDISDDPRPPRTIELWIKKRSGTPTVSATGTVYVNGAVSALANLRLNEWSLVHIVAASPVTGTITISGDIHVSQVVLYEPALTAAQVLDVYNNYTGRTTLVPSTVSTIAVSQPVNAADVYAHDWSITGGGA